MVDLMLLRRSTSSILGCGVSYGFCGLSVTRGSTLANRVLWSLLSGRVRRRACQRAWSTTSCSQHTKATGQDTRPHTIVGESIREIQNKAVRNGKKLLDFNTYACSMGFPARTIFEDRLRAFATK